jgi:hypothetical protein
MEERADLRSALATLRVIVGAMALGLIGFGVLAWFVAPVEEGNAHLTKLLFAILVATVVGEIAAWTVIQRVLLRQARARLATADSDQQSAILRQYVMTTGIIPAAMAEGIGLFALVIYMLDRFWLALVPAGAAVLALLMLIPTADSARTRISQMLCS